MKVFVAGATGAMGKQLVPRLVAAGHRVVGTTRSEAKQAALWDLGATPVVVDALDPDQVADAVAKAAARCDRPRADRDRDARHAPLRPQLRDDQPAADRRYRPSAVGRRARSASKRFVIQSYTSWPYARTGGPVKTEEDPLDPAPAREMRESLDAIRHLEAAVTGADWTEGIVLRYGGFYGPGTSLSPGGEQFEMVRKRKFPVVGDGAGVWSFVHIEDAAEATVAAVEHGKRGIYNVVDDDPAAVAEWLPALAEAIGAPKPWHVPRLVGRVLAGEAADRDDDRDPRGVERQGQARARLGAPAPELAGRVRGMTASSGPGSGEALLDELRPTSFAIAYRMLGSVAEAEDVVQEALLRVHRALEAGERIESPRAFVATITTRLAIDELRSARARRERYVGEWLPEPILTDSRDDPAQHAEIADSLSMAMLVLLETLSPEQRAVLLLRDVFDYGYGEIAAIVGKSEDNVRQLATRARAHVEARRPRFETSREQRDELARRFFAAAMDGDLAGLEALLAHDVVLTGDGGGKVPALGRPLQAAPASRTR